jgi:hypothetical protein
MERQDGRTTKHTKHTKRNEKRRRFSCKEALGGGRCGDGLRLPWARCTSAAWAMEWALVKAQESEVQWGAL